MTIYRCVLPKYAQDKFPSLKTVVEGQFTDDEIRSLNEKLYNIYYLPNYPNVCRVGATVHGSDVDIFEYCFVDFDVKSNTYQSKDLFLSAVGDLGILPSRIVDSGNGIHVYWRVTDLDAMSYLQLTRRLMRRLNTDPAVGTICQLMRAPGTNNTKVEGNPLPCEVLYEEDISYTCEQLDGLLPLLSPDDAQHCLSHFQRTYGGSQAIEIDDALPPKFCELLANNKEVKDIWLGNLDDRSKGDFRLGNIMLAADFTKDEAASVLVNSAKALSRSSEHRVSYAYNIVDKIWRFKAQTEPPSDILNLSSSVKEILARSPDTLKGTRFPCWKYLDNTDHGFRLGQIIGLVAGSGVGKTAIALNMFLGFVQCNPDYDHFFVPLEQPANEIADRWKTMCGDNTSMHDKVHILSNFADDGSPRLLSFGEIKDYILKFQKHTSRKIGCVVIDHIGALRRKGKDGENQDLIDICHDMKAFAIETNTLLVMQSQSPKGKAGIGDLELDKDAGYGTIYFEAYCDYLVTLWQPLKRVYVNPACPTVTAFKFCKIRHKKQTKDVIKEDVCYRLFFDPDTQRLRELTSKEETSFTYFLQQATNIRKQDRRTDIVSYVSAKMETAECKT